MAFCRQKLGTRATTEHNSRLNFEEGVALCGGFSLLLPAPSLGQALSRGQGVHCCHTPQRAERLLKVSPSSISWGCWTPLLWQLTDAATEVGMGAPKIPGIRGPWAPFSCWDRQRVLSHLVGWTGRQKRARDSVWLGKSPVPETQLCSSPAVHYPSTANSSWALLLVICLSVWTPMASTTSEYP